MEIISDSGAMQEQARAWRTEGRTIAFVPTMGYFHQGHLSLMRYGREQGRRLVVSLFVNPAQFGPSEDLDRYPRDLERDAGLAAAEGVDVLFTPTAGDMYPSGYQTYVEVGELSRGLCGASRPGHFRGVATVVLKLFNLAAPDVAVFGEKDYQQLRVIQQMAADLNLPVRVVGRPIVREPDGLALSSRNTYLSIEERRAALSLIQGLNAAAARAAGGERRAEALLGAARAVITASPLVRLDYLELADPDTLKPVERLQGAARLLTAAWVGATRLIDNILIEGD
ncbi:MAG: pantoate--beta-alanine ligase [Deltaproteobacteria bacterium]|nr:pantoate--beta-alanine ligase [Deltaproteobacteria bacterium]